MNKSIGASLKDNRRLSTFRMEKPEEFVAYLRTRYDSEIESWLYICPKDDWKYPFLKRENAIRIHAEYIEELKELAKVW